ncbi:hypothetical protein EW093_07710 [Thiospirochaeta perfilievii]|uniref:Uncharacterized protein n=1 Tax=Thiospirochaeta perfilievii TaxID=252967 RepID=A0A5C1Q914_9SPIO|nr:hypothetical protein [Thiospirochaeta perfilievii]QEN04593.1 hypothetical protein EW093_07710 [Thiospirochaeta perfilievii]
MKSNAKIINKKNTIYLTILGLILILYGFLARRLLINSFWESLYIGILLLLIALFFLFTNNRNKTKQKRFLIGQILIIFFWVIYFLGNVIIFNSQAYKHAKDFIVSNEKIVKELGTIQRFGYIINGSVTSSKDYSTSELKIITVGSTRTTEIMINLDKNFDKPWDVVNVYFLY